MRYPAENPVRQRAAEARGFTIIELLVVVTIIVLLLSVLGPAASQTYRLIETAISRGYLHTIDGGLHAYKGDFDDFPPSRNTDGGDPAKPLTVMTDKNAKGAQIIAYLLTGDIADDGKAGPGFRKVDRGPVFGPYGGCDGLTIIDKRFTDKFGNPILYYRFDHEAGTYSNDDNTIGPNTDINTYAKDDDIYARTDYLLLSRGHDKKWRTDASNNAADDITNLGSD